MSGQTYPRGSEWRKWDLHVHTPESYDCEYNGTDYNDLLVENLKTNAISVIAITDHHKIVTQRYWDIKNNSKILESNITVFPGVELRTDKGAGQIHIVAIFPEDTNVVELSNDFDALKRDTEFTHSSGDDDKIFFNFEHVCEWIKKRHGLITIHAGNKHKGVDREFAKGLDSADAIKEDIASKIDIFEVGTKNNETEYKQIVWPALEKLNIHKRPIIMCSDSHDPRKEALKNPIGERFTWIKADPTFKGLQQILNEPENRVYIGDIPPALSRIKDNKTKILTEIAVRKTVDSTLGEKWFDGVKIDLNPELVAIIGNKGSGKSALADIIGLLGVSSHRTHFSFLKSTKFLQDRKANNFEATITWKDGTSPEWTNLGTDVLQGAETVKYIPQRYLEEICAELSSDPFDAELEKVIFSHINSADQLGSATFQELKEKRTAVIKESMGQLIGELWKINKKIITIEQQLSPAYRQDIEKILQEKKREYDAFVATKPIPVAAPESIENSQETDLVQKEIDEKNSKLNKLKTEIIDINLSIKKHVELLAIANRVKEQLENFEHTVATLKDVLEPELKSLDVDFKDVFTYRIDSSIVKCKIDTISAERTRLSALVDATIPTSYISQQKNLSKEISDLQAKLDAPQRKYQEYLVSLSLWEDNCKKLQGDADTADTIAFLEKQLVILGSLPEQKNMVAELRINKAKEIYQKKQAIATCLTDLYAPAQNVLTNNSIAQENGFKMSFNVAIAESGFATDFLKFINKRRRGAFQGTDEGRNTLDSLLKNAKFDSWEGTSLFLQELLSNLARNTIPDQLLDSTKIDAFYNYIFSLNYLHPKYSLRWDGKELQTLSPGEKGNLLLIFFLLVDKDTRPLIIDQPEDNLDNQTIFKTLVPSINDAKKKRQIIIVTHNPNLAVVADADQVIYSHIDKRNENSVDYISGAIENPVMNKHILDVLEGTRPAFDARDSKYINTTRLF